MTIPRQLVASAFFTLIVLVVIGWLVWPDKAADPTNLDDDGAERGNFTATGKASIGSDRDDEAAGFKSSRRPLPATRSGPQEVLTESEARDRIDSTLLNEAISNEQAAENLRNVASMSTLPLDLRMEALEHGTLLDLTAFAPLTGDPELPEEMALVILGQAVNFNEKPSVQIDVYRKLIDHPSADVQEEALDMLRFIVEDDHEEMDRAALLRAAEEKWNEAVREEAQDNG